MLPITSGLKKLSIAPTRIADQAAIPIAPQVFPVEKRKMMDGTETKAVPIVGKSEENIATNPQRAGFGTPKSANPIPMSNP